MLGYVKTLSDQIRAAVEASGLPDSRVAEAIGVDKSSMSRFMRGERGLTLNTLDRLGTLLRVQLSADGPTKATLARFGSSPRGRK